jgi:hypothetical protein
MDRQTSPAGRAGSLAKPILLLTLALATIGFTVASDAQVLDRWKHPQARPGAALFRGQPRGPSPNPSPKPAVKEAPEPNRDATAPGEARTGEPRRDPIGGNPNEPRPNDARLGEPPRLNPTPAERRPGELQRGGPGNLQAGIRRPAFGNPIARAGTPGQFRPGPFGRAPLARGPFGPGLQPRLASLVPRRPLIGERGFTGVPAAGETRFLTNEMVFHVDRNVSPQTVDAVARRLGLATVASQGFGLSGGTLFRFRITNGRPVAEAIRALEAEHIGTAQPNYVFKLQQGTTQAARPGQGDPSQYVVNKLHLVDVHRIAIGADVPIAVIDSAIDARHPELAGAVIAEFDSIHNQDKPHAHGTGMAGAIAAHRRLMGVAPGARILAVHAFSSNSRDSAEATSAHILAGIDWAIAKGARIINMSFAGPDDPMLQLALQRARDKGVILIAAAGNAGPKSPPLYPAADPNVIAVTATDANDKLMPQANQGPYVAVAAPGVDILEPAPNAGYQLTTGTSVAAAHVSGTVALLLDREPRLDAAAVLDVLTSSARDVVHQGRNDQFGYGIVDPQQALKALDAKVARGWTPAPEPAAKPGPISAR